MLQDLKPPMNPKEISLTTHPDASTKMYGINKNIWSVYFHLFKFKIVVLVIVENTGASVDKNLFKLLESSDILSICWSRATTNNASWYPIDLFL